MRTLSTLAAAAVLGLAACAPAAPPDVTGTEAPAAAATASRPETPVVGMANPASVACVEGGGTLRIYNTPEGQIGMCSTKDGRVCEEWGLFRDGKCDPLPAGATLAAGPEPQPQRP